MLIHNIWLATKHNLYDSKRHFTAKLSEAFQRRGITTKIFDQELFPVWNPSLGDLPDLTCSFHRLISPEEPSRISSGPVIPHLSILVDPVFYYRDLIKLHGSICSCVDRSEYESLSSKEKNNVFFLPHGIEKDIQLSDKQVRPYDVVFMGSSYDPETLHKIWMNQLSPELCQVIDEAAELVFTNTSMAFVEATRLSLKNRSIDVSDKEFFFMACLVDAYTRGMDRVELIRSIKDAHVHVFGGISPRREHAVKGWGDYFFDQENVTVHPAVTFDESLKILQQSKIVLNSMPFFKNGSHERVFAALACGAMPITSESGYFREIFTDGEELLFYSYGNRGQVNDLVNYYLAHENARKQVSEQGRSKVIAEHSWDNRVDTILRLLPSLQAAVGGQSS